MTYQILEELSEQFAGWWVYEFNDDDKIVKKTPFRTKDDAEEYTEKLRKGQ